MRAWNAGGLGVVVDLLVAGEFLRRWLESLVISDLLVCGEQNGLLVVARRRRGGLSPNRQPRPGNSNSLICLSGGDRYLFTGTDNSPVLLSLLSPPISIGSRPVTRLSLLA